MGSDRYMESRMLAENNFWPARRLLERALQSLKDGGVNAGLRVEIQRFLEQTKQT